MKLGFTGEMPRFWVGFGRRVLFEAAPGRCLVPFCKEIGYFCLCLNRARSEPAALLAAAKGLHTGFRVLGPSICAMLSSWCLETIKHVLGDAITNRTTPRQTDQGFKTKLVLFASYAIRLFLLKL